MYRSVHLETYPDRWRSMSRSYDSVEQDPYRDTLRSRDCEASGSRSSSSSIILQPCVWGVFIPLPLLRRSLNTPCCACGYGWSCRGKESREVIICLKQGSLSCPRKLKWNGISVKTADVAKIQAGLRNRRCRGMAQEWLRFLKLSKLSAEGVGNH